MNASPSTTRARDGQSPKATLVHCFRYAEVDVVLVDRGFNVMISARTISSDASLIAWADTRARILKARRAV